MQLDSLRKAYGLELVELGKQDKNVVVLEADLGKSTMSCLFQDIYPERYFQMGIAEQNMASVSAGLSLTGKIPFYSTFAVFATGRAYDQIRSSICIPNLNVKICGSSAGLSDYGDGKTHQSIDDIALMRVLPNMKVFVPVDANETRAIMKAIHEEKGPAYIRISRADFPEITEPNKPYRIGQMTKVNEGKDLVIFAYGTMVHQALKAEKMLEKNGLSARIVNVSTIKPLDVEQLKEYSKDMNNIMVLDEHSKFAGLGGAISEALAKEKLSIDILGIEDSFGCSASDYDILLNHYGLSPEAIVKRVNEIL
ncbi:MAG: transketolase C-terminal domain-containing protein [Sphaerochaetaceae bacterium]|nr:transketolase C-terminal domain-containing protein [Sphaerochaetaceae bacterium]